MCVVFASAVAGCGGEADDGSDEGLGEETADIVSYPLGDCPRNWVDPKFVQIDCAPGYMIVSIGFHGHECVRCLPEPGGGDDDEP